ncbi:glycoside hydrolase family 3 C-terminal domain-containing protein [Streptomyces sp. ISL-99]|uniref:glycoside hydrolase family 3 C-terminal domain-containing protein n=1 Tax=Streptomyces sp. ISL-99 TaxID=2819193 RepID=UPI001BEA2397|nr:glycoside hydrolase family 3 C-terminal domain-containing protein [Streptomyces sp. ISL-99]MBT2527894.1 glycoside hydrolase family 3 C-terminal domain-containing protein [Streptomyces sp. ISL-99]
MTEEERARLLDKLDLGQKARLLTGSTTWRTRPEPAVGMGEMTSSDGPVGVRGEAWDERTTSMLLPSPTALAAMWEEDLVERLGSLLATEARRKGVHVVLAPTLNLHRSPLGGRHFECFAEDPELTGRTGAALIRGIQAHGVAATAKHYVANDSETERLTVDVRVAERVLREVYLAPFEAAVAAGVWLVMAGYNGVNGATMTENPLLAEPLKGEWGFDGVVVSDWGAVRSTVATAFAAHDLAMPGPESPWGDALVQAVREETVPLETVDDKVRRILRLADRVGVLGVARPDRTGPARPGDDRELLRRAVAAGSVLLRNDGVLPLEPATLRTVAVIGAHATQPRVQGGGSAGVFPHHVVSPWEGIRSALGEGTRVAHAPGPALGAAPPPLDRATCRDPRSGTPGLLVRVLDAEGHELHAEHRFSGRQMEPFVPPGAHRVEISALLEPATDGEWTFGVGGFGRMSLTVDGRPVIDGTFPRETDDPAVVHVNPPCQYGRVRLTDAHAVHIVASRELAPDTGRAILVTAGPPVPDPASAIAEAAEAARNSDAAVVFVGTTENSESEGHDRTDLALPGHQDELVRAVAAANPRTVVVVNAGGPVELPWREEAGAVLLSWFPGQEAGTGLADVLFGRAEPGGRLPTTWGAALSDVPVTDTAPEDGVLEYAEGLHIGYRAWLRAGRTPAYWFGHGLGYTTWEYERLDLPEVVPADGSLTARVRIRNTGGRRGREVVQVYLAKPGSAVERPVRWLAGYAAVEADPGERVAAAIRVPAHALRHWSEADGAWRTESGVWQVLAGRSAGELPLTATTTSLSPARRRESALPAPLPAARVRP